jgi:colicin import membrane protein
MTAYPSILKAAHVERGMRWMIFVSLCLHLCLIAAVLGKPPDRGKTIYFNPAYTVELIGTGGSSGAPGLPDTGEQSGESSGGSSDGGPTGRAEPLWKGPSGFTSQVKTLEKRTHSPVQTETAIKAPPSTRKTASSNSAGSTQGETGSGRQAAGQSGSGTGAGGGGGIGGTGYGLTPEQARFGRYYMAVFNKIQSAWVLPHYYEQKQLMAIVEITIRKDGRIVTSQFEKKSGNANFDRSVMRAIQKANPLPPLPPGIKEPLLTLGIRFQ